MFRFFATAIAAIGFPAALGALAVGFVSAMGGKVMHHVRVQGSLATHYESHYSFAAKIAFAGMAGILWTALTVAALYVASAIWRDKDWRSA